MRKYLFLSTVLTAALTAQPRRASATGTYTLNDLLNYDNTSAETFGYQNLTQVIQTELTAHNAVVGDAMRALATPTTEREEGAPAGSAPRMVKVDPDFGRSRTQKGATPGDRGFPLDAFEFAAGWTAMFLRSATPADLARITLDARLADVNGLRYGLMTAFFNPINYDFADYVVPNKKTIKVKALANGDSELYPMSPSGKKFAAGHNHFLFSNGLTVAAIDGAVQTVAEHSQNNQIAVYINQGNEAAFRGLAGFVPLLPGTINAGANQQSAQGALITTRTDDRPIGYLPNGSLVHTKPWVPLNYALPINLNGDRPLKMRQHRMPGMQGLFLHGTNGALPLQADAFQRYFGFGASNRTGASVLYFATGATAYEVPNFEEYLDEEGSDL